MQPLHPNAAALSAFRAAPYEYGRGYSIAEPVQGRSSIERLLRMAAAVGYVQDAHAGDGAYAVLDVLDEKDDIVQDYSIPNARAFRWWYRKLGLRMEP